jgi:molybdopterin biosynthesis enzyme
VLREAGEIARELDVALATTAGITECEVRSPRLLLAATQGTALGALDLIAALAQAAGAEVEVSDSAGSVAAAEADLAVLLGPTAPVVQALLPAGARVIASRLALRPGEDSCALRLGPMPFLVGSDRLADALGLWLALGLPTLRALAGGPQPRAFAGTLTRKISSGIGLAELVLLRRRDGQMEPLATGDLSFRAIAAADCWSLVPPESEGFAAGETVRAEGMPGR